MEHNRGFHAQTHVSVLILVLQDGFVMDSRFHGNDKVHNPSFP